MKTKKTKPYRIQAVVESVVRRPTKIEVTVRATRRGKPVGRARVGSG